MNKEPNYSNALSATTTTSKSEMIFPLQHIPSHAA